MKSFILGSLLDNDSLSDTVTMTFIPPENCIIMSDPDQKGLVITKSTVDIFEPGGNVFFRYLKKYGNGLLGVNTVGLVRVAYNTWWFKTTEFKVQFYNDGGFLVAPEIISDKLYDELLPFVDYGAPISEYRQKTIEDCTILYFDPFKRFGIINVLDGEKVYFDWNSMANKSNINMIIAGSKVAFRSEQAPEGSKTELKATSVKLI